MAQGFQLDYALRLTPVQIIEIHGHKRDDDGNIKQPESIKARKQLPPTYENKLAALEALRGTGLISEAEYKRARAEITAKFGPPEAQAAAQAPEKAPSSKGAKGERQVPRPIPKRARPTPIKKK